MTTPTTTTASTPTYWPTVVKRYPSNPITPHGAYYLLSGKAPTMRYRSHDDTCLWDIFGGPAIADRTTPECVQVMDMKGLIPPWQNITQKGATQDGATYVDSLYDPCEVDMTVRIKGRDAIHTRRVLNDWIASWDAKQPGELSWFTHDLGRWWAQVRWSKNVVDKFTGGSTKVPQTFVWSAIAYDAFWRSYDCVDSFGFTYDTGADNFAYTTTQGLGSGWTIHNSAAGGWLYSTAVGDLSIFGIPYYTPGNSGMVQFAADPANTMSSAGLDIVAVNNAFASATDDQVVSITVGSMPSWFYDGSAFNDIWLRCPAPGTGANVPGQSGVRLRVGNGVVTLSYFVNGVETVLRSLFLLIPPVPGETWTVAASGRSWTVTRGSNGGASTVMQVIENGANSPMGPSQRHAGFGVHAVPLATPASVLSWSAGDNTTTGQPGSIKMSNAGDQPMFPRWTLYGPGLFSIGDGPNNGTNAVTIGPLLDNQVVQVRTDPRKRGITDLTSQPNSPQALTVWQQAFEDFLSFAIGNNTVPLVQSLESQFGITPPQGNIYSLMNGRFSDASGIPPRTVGGPIEEYEIPVSIAGGNASSRIVAAGTPLRRFPY